MLASPQLLRHAEKRRAARDTPGRAPLASAPSLAAAAAASACGVLVLSVAAADSAHRTPAGHQESGDRIRALLDPVAGCLRREALRDLVRIESVEREAPLADLARVHEMEYVAHLRRVAEVAASPSAGPGAAMIDADTLASRDSLRLASVSAAAAIDAVRRVVEGAIAGGGGARSAPHTAFVACRPPGHHAGPRGVVAAPPDLFRFRPDLSSLGFCLFANAAIAAAWARYHYASRGIKLARPVAAAAAADVALASPSPVRPASATCADAASSPSLTASPATSVAASSPGMFSPSPPGAVAHAPSPLSPSSSFRVAIVDIDIHHGNGTEAVVRNLRPHMERLPLPGSMPPISVFSHKPWFDDEDHENVLAASVHLFDGKTFYPGSGGVEKSDEDHPNIINLTLTPLTGGPGDGGGGGGGGSSSTRAGRVTEADRARMRERASEEFRDKVSRGLLPRLREFCPDLLLISAGFDGHFMDMYHHLRDEDFFWVTAALRAAVEPAGGRVVSLLEGGYSLAAPPGDASPLAGSAAAIAATAPLGSTRGNTRKQATSKATATTATAPPPVAADLSSRLGELSLGGDGARTAAVTAAELVRRGFGIESAADGGLQRGVLAHVCALALPLSEAEAVAAAASTR